MRRTWTATVVVALWCSSFLGCGGGSDGGPTSASVSPGASTAERLATSHNAGRDCLACHREFTVAGTLYRGDGTALAGGALRLTTAAEGAGNAVVTLTSDGSGNFYSRQSVVFGSGLYADAAAAGSAARVTMKAAVASGACNSCHGPSRRITAN